MHDPFAPFNAPSPGALPTIPVTHLAKKPLPMRHKTPPLHLNSQKNRSLKRHK